MKPTDVINDITRNVTLLRLPNEPVRRIDYSIASVDPTIQDEKTLDVCVFINCEQNLKYSNLNSLWLEDVVPMLEDSAQPWEKAKKTNEFLYAVAANDRTTKIIDEQEYDLPERAAIFTELRQLIAHYTSLPVESQLFTGYAGRNDTGKDFEQKNKIQFLEENRTALNTLIFSQKKELEKLYDHCYKFAELKQSYSTVLRGIKDGK